MANLPPVKVSPTLAELYPALEKPIALVPIIALSNRELTESVPRSSKFLYQDTTINENSDDEHTKTPGGQGPSPTVKYLSLIPQRFAFAAGSMPVVMFDIAADATSVNRKHVLDTLAVIEDGKRPQLHFFSGPADKKLSTGVWTLADSFPMDGLEAHTHVLSTEVHYELLSKGGLADSGLQTPACKRLVVESVSGSFDTCCNACLLGGSAEVITDDCTGHRREWLTAEVEKILDRVRAQPVPFVLKFQQTVSGAGTYIVTTASDLESLLEDLPMILKSHLPKINRQNKHLDPGDVLVTDMVKDIEETLPLTFFVQANGNCVFICCAEQHLDDEGQYAGATITYSKQEDLRKRLAGSMAKIGELLHRRGYYGPVGADILEDAAGVQWVVDLNVRTPSSLILGVLKEHFTSRGLDVATLASQSLRVNRDTFCDKFRKDLDAGKVVIVGWHEEGNQAWAELVLAGQNIEDVEHLQEQVKEC